MVLIFTFHLFLQSGYTEERENKLNLTNNIVKNRIATIKDLIKDPNRLILMMETTEKALSNLKVESELWIEQKKTIEDNWKRTPMYCSSTAWFDGRIMDKIRIDVHKQVLEWREGAAPYGEDSYSLSFNGSEGREIHHKTGPYNKTFVIKEGKRIPETPSQLNTGWPITFTGAYFSFHFRFRNNKRFSSFSELFRASFSGNPEAHKYSKITFEEYQGVPCIKIGSGNQKWGWLAYWLDPYRGFAPLGYEKAIMQTDGRLEITESFRLKQLEEVAPNIWYPKEAWGERSPLAPSMPYTRYIYKANKVVANDPNLDDSIFTIELPDDYRIDDQVDEKNISRDNLKKPSSIEQQIEMIRIELLNISKHLRVLQDDVNRLKMQRNSEKRSTR